MRDNIKFERSLHNPAAILNNDNEALTTYKNLRDQRRKSTTLIQRVESMENDINQIKAMLQTIMEKL